MVTLTRAQADILLQILNNTQFKGEQAGIVIELQSALSKRQEVQAEPVKE